MLEEYSFHTKQINYLRNAMAQVPGFLPDGKTLAQVDTLLGTREQPRKEYLAKHTALTTARGEVHEAQATGHKTAVAVYGLMKSIYRNLPAMLESIQRVPVDDRTPDETLTRLGKLSEMWATLPNMPGNNKPFVAGKITKDDVDEEHDDLEAKLKTLSRCDQEFQTVAGVLNDLDAKHVDFIGGALAQGRKQFEPGTAERRVIDAVPTPSAPAASLAPQEPTANSSAAASTEVASVKAAPAATTAKDTAAAPSAPEAPQATAVNFIPPPKAANE